MHWREQPRVVIQTKCQHLFMDSKWIQSLLKVYSFIHVIKVSLPDCICQDCNTIKTKGKCNLILMVGPRLQSNLQGDPESSISQAMEWSAWNPSPLYPCTFVLVFHTGVGTDCPTLVCVERNQPAEGGQVERNWVKNLPRWGVLQLWWDNSFHLLWDLHQIIPHVWNSGRPKHWEESACIVYLDFSKAFGTASQSIPLEKLLMAWTGVLFSVWKTGWIPSPEHGSEWS